MSILSDFITRLPDAQREIFLSFSEPYDVQMYHDSLRYNAVMSSRAIVRR